jgi:peptidoglycan LD-endopeptidase CwlK
VEAVSSRSLSDLRPEIVGLVHDFLNEVQLRGIDMLVTCTLRSDDEQAALYAQGRSAPGPIVTDAPAGESAHNHGLAIDVVPMVNGKPDWNGSDSVWEQLGMIGQSCGLEWAGEPGFPFPEKPHFQMPNWRTIAGI